MFGLLDLILTYIEIILYLVALPAIYYVIKLLRQIEENTRNK
ncbi:hypothetical protein SAMN05421663_10564 [Terribacillus halophilus]|uniref:Uncharacterized protein n=1 Tax=Terribacillus halophilus TaxID=361279 RepID=A0A1G6QHQ6_9BACI|nr:hypothetical protein SAMN05421663_10564 [Terribacillus halophilus]